ncbi:TPA: ead/Ea22-like family protein [Klebsiella quasipneumoniae subsp. similipneumoniae]|nr:ead/Ea22-like family protein [Klebsiella quasipneumoniae subsp. similipneumoniae]HDU6189771.1 ead/Ea22-like family protein [Klebsiella quasipneumoniae subsp. similipneumoniae]
MTDITELAQRMRTAAEKATPGQWERGDGKHGGELLVYCDDALGSAVCEATSEYNAIPKYQRIDNLDFIALANPANVLALVEALEKAQGMETYWKTQCRGITDHCEELQARIAELESRTVTAAAADVLAERKRQVTTEGWTPEHDDQHVNFEMAIAGGLYAISAVDSHHKLRNSAPSAWPWDRKWWKPDGPRRDLVKAGALILAEIERLDRAAGIKVEAE